jgi:hypothetical protein
VAWAVVLIGGDWLTAAGAGLVWVLTPSATFFTPWLDQLNTLLVTTSFALLLTAGTARCRAAWSIAAGIAGGTALFFSYGTAPMLGAGVLMAGVVAASTRSLTRFASTAAFCAVGLGLVIAAIELAGFPQLGVARAALRAHAAFTQSRQAGLWLWANWIDFAIYFGAASGVLLVATLMRRNGSGIAGRLALCVVGVMIVTDLSGTARGEVGRLWMPFMPLLIVAIWPPMVQSMLDSGRARPRDLGVVAMLLMTYSIELARHWMFW